MKKQIRRRILGLLAVLAASIWLLFVIDLWEYGTATCIPMIEAVADLDMDEIATE